MKENLLDSFDNSKKKCSKCKNYFKTLDKEKTICINCNARNVNKILAEIYRSTKK